MCLDASLPIIKRTPPCQKFRVQGVCFWAKPCGLSCMPSVPNVLKVRQTFILTSTMVTTVTDTTRAPLHALGEKATGPTLHSFLAFVSLAPPVLSMPVRSSDSQSSFTAYWRWGAIQLEPRVVTRDATSRSPTEPYVTSLSWSRQKSQ